MSASRQRDERLNRLVTNRTPAGRWGAPGDLEAAAVFLADKRNSFHTGDSLVVDGGFHIA